MKGVSLSKYADDSNLLVSVSDEDDDSDTYRATAVKREISVTRGSELTVRFRFVFSRLRFGSGLYFFNYKRC